MVRLGVGGCIELVRPTDRPTDGITPPIYPSTHPPTHEHTAAMQEAESEAEAAAAAASKKGKGKAAARESVDGAGGKERSFQEIVSGKEQYEVCRLFLASLQLVRGRARW